MQHHNFISSFLKGVQIFDLPLSVKERRRIPAAPEMHLQQLGFIPFTDVTLHCDHTCIKMSEAHKLWFLHRRGYIFKAHILGFRAVISLFITLGNYFSLQDKLAVKHQSDSNNTHPALSQADKGARAQSAHQSTDIFHH